MCVYLYISVCRFMCVYTLYYFKTIIITTTTIYFFSFQKSGVIMQRCAIWLFAIIPVVFCLIQTTSGKNTDLLDIITT